jgi:hypothetical protein
MVGLPNVNPFHRFVTSSPSPKFVGELSSSWTCRLVAPAVDYPAIQHSFAPPYTNAELIPPRQSDRGE